MGEIMAFTSKNKIVSLRILEILSKYSDEKHPISATKIIDYLSEYDLEVERKSIYRNIAALEQSGYDIIHDSKGYFLGSRAFECAEIRLLIDAIQSARFISTRKTRHLINKLGTLCSKYEFDFLKKQVFVDSRTKGKNEEIFYSIDSINKAILDKKKLSFKYLKYDENKESVPRYGGMIYKVNPYNMVWVDDVYYLIANMDKYDGLAHYRLDRMMSVKVMDKKRRSVTTISGFEKGLDAAEYVKGRFTMFSGDEIRVQVRFDNSLRDVVYDRLGTEVTATEEGNSLVATFKVLPSKGFFSWLFLLGEKAEIVFPKEIKEQYSKMLKEILDKYN